MEPEFNSENLQELDHIGEAEYELIVHTAQQARPGETPRQAALRRAFDIAAIGLMRDALLRSGEAAAARWQHLQREEDGSGRLTIPFSKADQPRRGHVAYVSARTMNALDEMLSIKQAMGIDIEEEDRIFQMGSRQLRRHIRNACSFAGLEGRYGGNSPRIGMVQDLARSGASLPSLMAAGRWKTPTSLTRHLFNLNPATGAVAQWHALH